MEKDTEKDMEKEVSQIGLYSPVATATHGQQEKASTL